MIESVIIAAILAPWRKAEWKSFIKKSVITHWVTILRAYAAIKSTLSCIDLHDVNPHSSPPQSKGLHLRFSPEERYSSRQDQTAFL